VIQNGVLHRTCLERILPIFVLLSTDSTYQREAKLHLVESFIPFLSHLETDIDAQQRLLSIVDLIDSTALGLVAGAFLRPPLPFIEVGFSYADVVKRSIRREEATQALELLGILSRWASHPLLESILFVSTDLLSRFACNFEHEAIFPLYVACRRCQFYLKSSAGFLSLLLQHNVNFESASRPLFERHFVEELTTSISQLADQNSEVVATTTCGDLKQLRGVIDQSFPPKIYPYAIQWDMYVGLKKEVRGPRHMGRSNQRMSIANMSATRSMIWSAPSGKDFVNVRLSELTHHPIALELLQIPTAASASANVNFVLSPTDFAKLPP
jgi:hypothetical protein